MQILSTQHGGRLWGSNTEMPVRSIVGLTNNTERGESYLPPRPLNLASTAHSPTNVSRVEWIPRKKQVPNSSSPLHHSPKFRNFAPRNHQTQEPP